MIKRFLLAGVWLGFALVPVDALLAEPTASQRAVLERIQRYRDRHQKMLEKKTKKEFNTYSLSWKVYGNIEIKRDGWLRKDDQVWMTELRSRNGWKMGYARFQESEPDTSRNGILSNRYYKRLEAPEPGTWIAVSCRSLMLASQAFGDWRVWLRPTAGSSLEQLIVDRCSTDSRIAP